MNTITFNFTDSPDFTLPNEDYLHYVGKVPCGVTLNREFDVTLVGDEPLTEDVMYTLLDELEATVDDDTWPMLFDVLAYDNSQMTLSEFLKRIEEVRDGDWTKFDSYAEYAQQMIWEYLDLRYGENQLMDMVLEYINWDDLGFKLADCATESFDTEFGKVYVKH